MSEYIRIAIVAITIAVLAPSAAWSQAGKAGERWLKLSASSANAQFEIEMNSVERKGDVAKFRERLTFLKPERADPYSGRLIKEKRVVRMMNCADRTQAVKAGGVFDPGGRLVEWVMVEDDLIEWFAIPPATVAEREFSTVCAAAPQR